MHSGFEFFSLKVRAIKLLRPILVNSGVKKSDIYRAYIISKIYRIFERISLYNFEIRGTKF